ncbi:programmed cell death protein 1 [Carettochelys insculpta]|uniref:programmed cell death protein 1 n=1 Tax=Carettochelys insculpta TaxID=44489 RepID=UPI003EBFAC83
MPGTMLLLVLSFCAALLTCQPAPLLSQHVTFHPKKLSLPEGDTASFFCNVSTALSRFSLNWYKKVNSSYTQKIAELTEHPPSIQKEKFRLVNHTSAVEIKILNLTRNDTGEYYCGLIDFSSPTKVVESNVSQLTVTEPPALTTLPSVTDDKDVSVGDFQVPLIIILSVAGAVLLVLIAYMLMCYFAGQQKPPRENAPLKEEQPPEMTVYTVDYGVLVFQPEENLKAPVEGPPCDQTEYATIMFLDEKPVTPERGKKTKSPSTQAQPC